MVLSILRLAVLLLYAFFFGISLLQLIAPWEKDVSGRTFVEYHHNIDRYMSLWARLIAQAQLILTLAMLIMERRYWQTLPFLFIVIAFALVITSVLVAIRGNVPLNQLINTWSSDNLPANWSAIRDQWLNYHQIRAWVNITAFGFLLIGILRSHDGKWEFN